MTKEDEKGGANRSFNRIIYNPQERPNITIGDHVFAVADISEKGLRLISDKKIKPDLKLKGKLTLLCGEALDVQGVIIWQEGSDFGLQFDNLLASDIILKEQRHILVSAL